MPQGPAALSLGLCLFILGQMRLGHVLSNLRRDPTHIPSCRSMALGSLVAPGNGRARCSCTSPSVATLTWGQPAGGRPTVIGVMGRGPHHVLLHHHLEVEDKHDDSPILVLHGYHVHQAQEAAPCGGGDMATVAPRPPVGRAETRRGPSTAASPGASHSSAPSGPSLLSHPTPPPTPAALCLPDRAGGLSLPAPACCWPGIPSLPVCVLPHPGLSSFLPPPCRLILPRLSVYPCDPHTG